VKTCDEGHVYTHVYGERVGRSRAERLVKKWERGSYRRMTVIVTAIRVYAIVDRHKLFATILLTGVFPRLSYEISLGLIFKYLYSSPNRNRWVHVYTRAVHYASHNNRARTRVDEKI